MSHPVHLTVSTSTHVVTRKDANRLRLDEERGALLAKPETARSDAGEFLLKEGADNPRNNG
jgi:hypothetical protein